MKNKNLAFSLGIFTIMMLPALSTAGWISEVVDSNGDVGRASTLCLTSMGDPCISYYDETSDTLKYAYKDAGGWHKGLVESAVSIGRHSDMVLDASDNPHIVYIDWDNYNPKYAVKNGSTWQTENIDDTGILGGEEPSITLDSMGYPHVTFCRGSYEVFYAHNTGSSWTIESIETDLSGGHGESEIQLDSNDNIHVLYLNLSWLGGTIRYGFRNSGGWTLEDAINLVGDSGGYMGLSLNPGQTPGISYYNSADMTVNYAVSSGGWQTESIDVNNDYYAFTSIVYDPAGHPHIAYYHEEPDGDGYLRYATKTDTGWITQTVDDSDTYVGTDTSIALDADNNPHISYYDWSKADLKYAYFEPGTCDTTGVQVTMPQTTFTAGDHCSCTAIVCNAEGYALDNYPLFVLLGVVDTYYFAPTFNTTWDYYSQSFSIGQTSVPVLPDFIWPDVGGPVSGIMWYGALLTPEQDALFGDYGYFSFGWE